MTILVLILVTVLVLWGIIENRAQYRKLMRGDLFVHYDSQACSRPGPSSVLKTSPDQDHAVVPTVNEPAVH
jgi:hypothetical protein